MKRTRFQRSSVKEAFDNLPVGVCFFGENGICVLCNRQMHRLSFALTGRDLQLLTDLTDVLENLPADRGIAKDGENYILADSSVWRFTVRTLQRGETYTEILATNVSELYAREQTLLQSTAEHRQMVEKMRRIVSNVTDITREEEILDMKMKIHSEVGVTLQRLRRFLTNGCPADKKQEVIVQLEKTVDSLMGRLGKTDEIDPFAELLRIADTLGVTVKIDGVMPPDAEERNPVIMALRECITNTLRHSGGNTVTVEITDRRNCRCVKFTNNGAIPAGPVVEGGGLTSLRRQIEKIGGGMKVESTPVYALLICLPKKREEQK